MLLSQFTPHARGSTLILGGTTVLALVYPACAGIDPIIRARDAKIERLPRMRGDRPDDNGKTSRHCHFIISHARGSTCNQPNSIAVSTVYPACAGIDRSTSARHIQRCRLPRMRGDRPMPEKVCLWLPEFTPHARGSTPIHHSAFSHVDVYPACAGIDPMPGM